MTKLESDFHPTATRGFGAKTPLGHKKFIIFLTSRVGMKMGVKIVLSLMLLFPHHSNCLAQRLSKAYVINKSGDTIQGKAVSTSSYALFHELSFKTTSKKFISYRPGDILGFYVDGIGLFKSLSDNQIDNSTIDPSVFFFQELIRGPISLFVVDNNGVRDRFFVSKGGRFTELIYSQSIFMNEQWQRIKSTNTKYLKTLDSLFSDRRSPRQIKIGFDARELSKVISEYNQEMGRNERMKSYQPAILLGLVISVRNSKTLIPYQGGPVAVGNSRAPFADLRSVSGKVYEYSNMNFGIATEIFVNRGRHFSFLGQLVFSKSATSIDQLTIDFRSFEVPLFLKCRVGLGWPVKPFAGIGIVLPLTKEETLTFSGLDLFDASGNMIVKGSGTYLAGPTLELEFSGLRPAFFGGLEGSFGRSTVAIQYRANSIFYSNRQFRIENDVSIFELRYSVRLNDIFK